MKTFAGDLLKHQKCQKKYELTHKKSKKGRGRKKKKLYSSNNVVTTKVLEYNIHLRSRIIYGTVLQCNFRNILCLPLSDVSFSKLEKFVILADLDPTEVPVWAC